MTNPQRLCYISDGVAYFTNQPLDKQWGDDWNDAPYEHNSGEPYDNAGERITRLRYYGAHAGTPCEWPEHQNNSRWSVQDINNGAAPWLMTAPYAKGPPDRLMAGASPEEFIEFVQRHGGTVYVPVEDLPSRDEVVNLSDVASLLDCIENANAADHPVMREYQKLAGVMRDRLQRITAHHGWRLTVGPEWARDLWRPFINPFPEDGAATNSESTREDGAGCVAAEQPAGVSSSISNHEGSSGSDASEAVHRQAYRTSCLSEDEQRRLVVRDEPSLTTTDAKPQPAPDDDVLLPAGLYRGAVRVLWELAKLADPEEHGRPNYGLLCTVNEDYQGAVDSVVASLRGPAPAPEEAARDVAIEIVDGLLGYTAEFAPNRKEHEYDYERAERIIGKAFAILAPEPEPGAVKVLRVARESCVDTCRRIAREIVQRDGERIEDTMQRRTMLANLAADAGDALIYAEREVGGGA